MNLKTVELLFALALFLSMLFVAPISLTANHENASQVNLGYQHAAGGHPTTVFVGDPVGGGIPNANQTGNQTG